MHSVLLLVAVLAAAPAHAVPSQRGAARTATLAVTVSDGAGAPVAGVMVTVEGAASRSARTEGGRIVFEGLPAGPYRMRFEREGFITLERELTARAGAPTDVKVTLHAAPAPPPPPAPETAAPPALQVAPKMLDLLALIEKEFIGRGPGKTTAIACSTGGSASLIQVREQVEHAHADADAFVYVVAGEGSATLEGRTQRLGAGIFMLVPRGVAHAFSATGRNPLVLLTTLAGEPCNPAAKAPF